MAEIIKRRALMRSMTGRIGAPVMTLLGPREGVSPKAFIVCGAQVVPRGFFPRGASATLCTLNSGSKLRTQVDVASRYSDGSAKMLLVAMETKESLIVGATRSLSLVVNTAAPALNPGATWEDVAGASSVVLVLTRDGEEPVRVDVLRGMTPDREMWRAGPLVMERGFYADDPENFDGLGLLRLQVFLSFTSDGHVSADVLVCNDVQFSGAGGEWVGAVHLEVDGEMTPDGEKPVKLIPHTRAILPFSTRAVPMPALAPSTPAMVKAGILPNYDLTRGAAPGTVVKYAWTKYMPMTGGRQDIGYVPNAYAVALHRPDARPAYDSAIALAMESGSVPWHLWDSASDELVKAADTRYNYWFDYRDSRWQPTPYQASDWTPDVAHMPGMSAVPFMMTGRRVFLEQLYAQAGYVVMKRWPDQRNELGNGFALLTSGGQARGVAWSMREVLHAWWLAPDEGPVADMHGPAWKQYLESVLRQSLAFLDRHVSNCVALNRDYAGWPTRYEYEDGKRFAPWQLDFLTSVLCAASRLGLAEGARFLGLMKDWNLKRFSSQDGEWNPVNGLSYNLPRVDSLGAPLTNFADAQKRIAAQGADLGNGSNPRIYTDNDYHVLAMATIADLASALPDDSAELANVWRWLDGIAPRSAVNAWLDAEGLKYNVVPPGITRWAS